MSKRRLWVVEVWSTANRDWSIGDTARTRVEAREAKGWLVGIGVKARIVPYVPERSR